MKRIIFFQFTILLLISFQLIAVQTSPKKIALVVAVAKYPKSGGWSQISSDKDIPLITNALESQGFDDIQLLTDEDATKSGIIQAIETLIAKSNKGDIVVFHFSGHGQQIQDDNGDEKDDGYDEAIVPYNAQVRYQPGVYEGENHLRDDELDILFSRLRERLGKEGNLLVILDACHSGTATRGMAKTRGTMSKMAKEGYNPLNSGHQEVGMADVDKTNKTSSRGVGNDLASMIVLSGASPQQLNYETKDDEGNSVGSLSYAFSRAVRKSGKNTSYRGFFEEIKVDMSVLAPNQQPQIEGNIDVTIFGGEAVDQKAYLSIEKWKDENTLIVNGGSLIGLNAKSIVAFYPNGTTDPSKSTAIATGEVVSSETFNSTVQTSKPISKTESKSLWVFIEEQNYGDLTVNVGLDIKNKDLAEILLMNLKEVKLIALDNDNPDLVIEYNNKYTRGNNLQITTVTDMLLYDKPYQDAKSQEIVDEVIHLIKAFAQGNLLRNLDMQSSSFDVTFEFIPIIANADETEKSRFDIEKKMDANNTIEFNAGDYFKLKISNNGNRIAYYSLIDIQPDNQINILIPVYDSKRQIRIPATDFVISPGATIELDYTFVFGPPFGNEVFKLIASEKPLNLEPIILSRGSTTRGDMNPLELLLADSYATRGGGVGYTPNVPYENANTYTVLFKISK
ncbi:MAG: DUF4384 domain-containing protein [Bacteroidetes bacterium]|nr:DUF4384 domain-containing protein [Bacteroidota bacterium]MBT5530159.1 DUF4384 domain-containing protein [Cytophagia bacterium]MBT3799682.1 DUF4384 domain-containing protein [Bacteroidota bacterium]MBT3934814.1 DUF4384 domain-containing protein [Bacteroidota bacterium]MBT4338078.1 DUF4384 domain-containing protein [Bacteroidota bacterium]